MKAARTSVKSERVYDRKTVTTMLFDLKEVSKSITESGDKEVGQFLLLRRKKDNPRYLWPAIKTLEENMHIQQSVDE